MTQQLRRVVLFIDYRTAKLRHTNLLKLKYPRSAKSPTVQPEQSVSIPSILPQDSTTENSSKNIRKTLTGGALARKGRKHKDTIERYAHVA